MVAGRSTTGSPIRKVSPAELPWRLEEEEPTVALFSPSQPTPPETPDGWKKGSAYRPHTALALLFNEPFSWDFTRRQAGRHYLQPTEES